MDGETTMTEMLSSPTFPLLPTLPWWALLLIGTGIGAVLGAWLKPGKTRG